MSVTEISEPRYFECKQTICGAYRNGMHYYDMQQKFKLSYNELLSILHEEGMIKKGRKYQTYKKFNKRKKKIAALYMQGRNMLSIAKELGVDNGGVCYALKKAGLYKKTKFVTNRLSKVKLTIRNRQIVKMFQSGRKPIFIAKLFQRDVGRIHEILHEAGVYNKKITRLNKEQYAARMYNICQHYRGGASMNSIAKEFGITQPCVANILKKANLHNNRKTLSGYLTKEEIKKRNEKIYQLHHEGKNISEIAGDFGKTKSGIYTLLKRAGLYQSTVKLIKLKREKRAKQFCYLYKKGMRITDISKKLNAPKSSVRAVLKRKGLRIEM